MKEVLIRLFIVDPEWSGRVGRLRQTNKNLTPAIKLLLEATRLSGRVWPNQVYFDVALKLP